ncbi:hypothetical protein F5Y07DRAFT_138174 [Xylaria sp. FL0933]|nr:hypothetical protein F5Y07DRAFT_138174 [Xylaria sp. FL0933]
MVSRLAFIAIIAINDSLIHGSVPMVCSAPCPPHLARFEQNPHRRYYTAVRRIPQTTWLTRQKSKVAMLWPGSPDRLARWISPNRNRSSMNYLFFTLGLFQFTPNFTPAVPRFLVLCQEHFPADLNRK